MGGIHTFVISELARNADDAQLFGGDPGVVAKEAELVTNLDDQDGIHVLPLDVEELDLHGRQLAGLGALLLPLCRRRWFVLFGIAAAFVIIGVRAGALARTLKPASPERSQAVRVAELLYKLSMQLLLLPGYCGILVIAVAAGRQIHGRAIGLVSIQLGPGRRARGWNHGGAPRRFLRGRAWHVFGIAVAVAVVAVVVVIVVIVRNRPGTFRGATGSAVATATATSTAIAVARVFLQRAFAVGFRSWQDSGGGGGTTALLFVRRFLLFPLLRVLGCAPRRRGGVLLAQAIDGEKAGQGGLPLFWKFGGACHGVR